MANTERDALAQCLQEIEREGGTVAECLARYPEHRDALAPLLKVAATLRVAPKVAPRASFRQEARYRLLNQLASRRSATFWDRIATGRQPGLGLNWTRMPARVLVWVVIVSMVLFGGSRAVSASGGALPGDILYPVKVAVEDVRLALVGDEAAFRLYLEFAGARVNEMERLATAERFEDMPAAVNRLERQLQGAADSADEVDARDAAHPRALAEELKSSVSAHRGRLKELLGVTPASVRPAIERVLEAAVEDVEDEADDGLDGDDGGDVDTDADADVENKADARPDTDADLSNERDDARDTDVDSVDETDDVPDADADLEDETEDGPDEDADLEDEADDDPGKDADSVDATDDDPGEDADSADEADDDPGEDADSADEADDGPDEDADSADETDDSPDTDADSQDEADDSPDMDADSQDEADDSRSGSDDRPGNGSDDEPGSDSDVGDERDDGTEDDFSADDDSGAADGSGSDSQPEHGTEGDSDDGDEDD